MAQGAFNKNTHTPKGAWEFAGNGSVTVQSANGNQFLAITGNMEMRNVTLPGNITAGDSYAEDQCWRVTVTIPEMPSGSEIILMSYAGSKQEVADGGFQIKGGKVCYSTGATAQAYTELCDIAPGTYIFERDMDFNDPQNLLCSYRIYGTDGKQVAAAENIAIPTCTVVNTIKFITKKLDGTALLLDDYKIFLTGIATDFEIYDADLGIPLRGEDADTPHQGSVAYRLSWLNATDAQLTAGVIAAVYRGDALVEEKLVEKIAMLPGCDGVATGEVELSEGQTLKVYLKTSETGEFDLTKPADPNQPTEPTDPSQPSEPNQGDSQKGGISPLILAAIAAVVIIIAATVVILLPAKKKSDN